MIFQGLGPPPLGMPRGSAELFAARLPAVGGKTGRSAALARI